MTDCDVIIIGGGAAGLTAGIYASRARLKTALFEKAMPGGQIITTPLIENYPGFSEGINGGGLVDEMVKQAVKFGVEMRAEEVRSIEDLGREYKIVKTQQGSYKAIAVILALGAGYTKLNVPGEDMLVGRGVSYCATCDGPLFRNKEVIVVGGGDTAVEDAIFLANFCAKVNLVHRRDQLRAAKVIQERAFSNKKINFIWDTVVVEIAGGQRVESVKLKNVKTGQERVFQTNGVFIGIGLSPNTAVVKGLVEMDEKGYIITDENMAVSREGIFAAGDCRKKLLRQFVTACADGATAAFAAQKYIENVK